MRFNDWLRSLRTDVRTWVDCRRGRHRPKMDSYGRCAHCGWPAAVERDLYTQALPQLRELAADNPRLRGLLDEIDRGRRRREEG